MGPRVWCLVLLHKAGVILQACNPRLWEGQEAQKFKVSLGYIAITGSKKKRNRRKRRRKGTKGKKEKNPHNCISFNICQTDQSSS